MAKINKGYQSFFDFIRNHGILPAQQNARRGHQILGGLHPIAYMVKDFVDTFKPYKAAYYTKRDLKQPLSGVKNILKGITFLIGAPLFFLLSTINYIFTSGSLAKFASNMWLNFQRTTSWLLDGVSSIVRGATQVAATPLTWLIKIPLRKLITAKIGAPKIEQSKAIQRLVTKCENAVLLGNREDSDSARYEIHRKFVKATMNGQKANTTSKSENYIFRCQKFIDRNHEIVGPGRPTDTERVSMYLDLFRPAAAEERSNPSPARGARSTV